jgi:uncharacterized repeat protein (TIGR03803 family)
MKTYLAKPYLRPMIKVALSYLLITQAQAQTFTTLHSFTGGSDGCCPNAPLMLASNTVFGTTSAGGTNYGGTLFKLSTDGHDFRTFYSGNDMDNGDGFDRGAPLLLSSNILYGGSIFGGTTMYEGNLFGLNTDGTGFTDLYSFSAGANSGWIPWFSFDAFVTNSDGAWPGALVLSGNTIYGTAYSGGDGGVGTVFAVNTDGTGFTTLYAFSMLNPYPSSINDDGAWPNALVSSGNTLYGTAEYGGAYGSGVIFAINTDGTGSRLLHEFGGADESYYPQALVLSGDTLYGTTSIAGNGNDGAVFQIQTDGTGYAILHTFSNASDGSFPNGLVVSGTNLYGTASGGGTYDAGTVFKLSTDGTGFTVLHIFTSGRFNSDGAAPANGVVFYDNTLYGTANAGGATGNGTVFSISLLAAPPLLAIGAAGANVILTWPTNFTGFSLQSTTNLISSTVWSSVSPHPVVVNGQYTVTNPISGEGQFYRLSQ